MKDIFGMGAQAGLAISRLVAALAFVAGTAMPATADIYTYSYGLTSFPACDAPEVIAKIHQKFAWSEYRHAYRGVALVGIDRVRERLTEYYGQHPIPRRYCNARAVLSNGKKVSMPYLIEEGMWVAGTRWNVEFCATGYDRWRVHGGSCRVLRR